MREWWDKRLTNGETVLARYLGLLLGIFLVNVLPVTYQVLHKYGTERLDLLRIDALFVLAGTVLAGFLFGAVFGPKWGGRLTKAAFFVCALSAAIVGYSLYRYDVPFGAGIVTAILQTNAREALEFLSMYVGWTGLGLTVFGCAVSFALLRILLRLHVPKSGQHWMRYVLILTLLGGIGSGSTIWQQYRYYIFNDTLDVPFVCMGRAVWTAVDDTRKFEKLLRDAPADVTLTRNDSEIPYVVVILGESTARNRLHLYGYPLPNTPELDTLNETGELAVYRDVISPQGATVGVLRELFTFADAESDGEWYTYHNLIDVMNAAGYRTYWLSNQESSGVWGNVAQLYAKRSTVHAFTQLRESHEDTGLPDEAVFPLVDRAIADAGEKKFLVVHLMGTHVLYKKRYPASFARFSADDVPPPQDDLSESRRQEIAEYANAVLYHDFVVASLIERFRDKNALVIFLPDHGEAVYDNGGSLAGHVMDHPTAPMLEIPLVFWASPSFREKYPDQWERILRAQDRPYMTDDWIHTVLDLTGIATPEFEPLKSVVNAEFDAKRKRVVQGMDYDWMMR